MTKEELRKWATMGISQGDDVGNAASEDDSGKGLTGLISRFFFFLFLRFSRSPLPFFLHLPLLASIITSYQVWSGC